MILTGRITIIACASLLVKRSRAFHIAEEQTLALMKFNAVVALKNLKAKVALTFISGTLYGLSLPHMID